MPEDSSQDQPQPQPVPQETPHPESQTPSGQPTPPPGVPGGQTQNLGEIGADILNKLPPIPESWKGPFVQWYPWILIVFGVLGVLGSLAALGLFTAVLPFAWGAWAVFGVGHVGWGYLGIMVSGVVSALGVWAGWQMRGMLRSGWKLAMVVEGVSVATTLLSGNLFSFVFALFFVYLLWQVKERYTA